LVASTVRRLQIVHDPDAIRRLPEFTEMPTSFNWSQAFGGI
jgi:hypothetical protein